MALAVIVILAGIAGGYLYYNRPDRSPADLSQETASTSPEQKSESDQPERPEARTETPEKPPLPSRAASEATTSDTARPAAEAAGAQPSAPAERSAMTTMSETSSETAPGSAPGRETETAALTGQETRPPAEEAREEAAPREGHELTLTFHRECWVGLGIDNDVKVQKTYRAGESMTWKARKGFALRLGNYQGAKIVFDGRPVVKKLPSDQWILNLILPEGSRDIKSINWSAEKLE